jgi:hypothetical protein
VSMARGNTIREQKSARGSTLKSSLIDRCGVQEEIGWDEESASGRVSKVYTATGAQVAYGSGSIRMWPARSVVNHT